MDRVVDLNPRPQQCQSFEVFYRTRKAHIKLHVGDIKDGPIEIAEALEKER
jgi:hypothetical protein